MSLSAIFRSVGIVAVFLMLMSFSNGRLPHAQAVTTPISVETTDILDDPNDGDCDLYEALQAIFSQKSSGNPSVTYHECTAQSGLKAVIFTGAAAGGTISLPTGPGSLDLPMINDDVTITGPVILDGGGQKRVLRVAASGILTLENLTVQNGYTAGGGGAILSNQGGSIHIIGASFLGNEAGNDGGAIHTNGDLNIQLSNFTGNDAGREGGAIYQDSSHEDLDISLSVFNGNTAVKTGGALTINTDKAEISDTIFNGNIEQDSSPNSSTKGGGAIYMDGAELAIERSVFNGNLSLDGNGGAIATSLNTEMAIDDSSFNGNIAGDLSTAQMGGAIYNMELLTIRGATFLNNLSPKGNGGAIFNDKGAALDAANATFSANGAPDGDGGAFYNGNTQQGSNIASHITLRNVTLYANLANNDGAAIFNQDGNHTVSLGNTILDDASGPDDNCNRALTTLGHNLDSSNSCGLNGTGDLTNADADLEFLSFNGGPLADLFTHLPGENSDAIDAGDNGICSGPEVDNEDQTGGVRPKDGDANGVPTCDIGAVEADARIPGYGSTPIQPGPINFGTTTGSTPVIKSLNVKETGEAKLTVGNPTFGGPNAADFELASSASFDIDDGGASVNIDIRCTPAAVGTRAATFSLNTNDPLHPSVTYDLLCHSQAAPAAGFGSNPAVPGPLDFGQLKVSDSDGKDLTIMETGNDTLIFGSAGLSGTNAGDFTFNAFQTIIVDGGGDVVIPITCTPSGVGLRTATLSMTTNDPLQPNVSWNLVCEGTPPPSPLLESRGQSVTTPANLLDGVYGVDVSPDGKNLYATAFLDDAVSVFDRNMIDGTLTYRSGIANSTYFNGAQLVAVSPDGKHVYVTSGLSGRLVVLSRDAATGDLTIVQSFDDSILPDLLGAYGVTVSPNGRFIYVTSVIQSAIIGFERQADDTLVYRNANSDTSNVDLIGTRNLDVSPDGRNLYVTSYQTNDGTTGNILVYNIDPLTGAIDYEQTISEGDLIGSGPFFIILDGLGGAFDVVTSPDGADVYVVGTYDGTVMNFIRDETNGRLRYNAGVTDGKGGVDGLDGVSGIDITPDGKHVATTAFNDAAIAVFERNFDNGRLSQIQVIKRGLLPPFRPLLDGARDIDISPDGTSVHAAAYEDDAVVSLHTINPVPALDTLFPASAPAGQSGQTVSISGQDFLPGATAVIDSVSRPATYVNNTTLEVGLNASDLASVGTLQIGVANPIPGGGPAATELPFTVTAVNQNPVPSIAALLPGGILAGGNQNLTLTVQGTNFIPDSKVRWNGANRSTNYVNSSTLEATILAGELSSLGTSVVTVFNPGPGGGLSNPAGFTISLPWVNPMPTILSLEPKETTIHGISGEAVTVSIQGTGFIEDSKAQWNGEDRPSQYIDESKLEITLSTADTTNGGTGNITVHNPPSGGGTSNAVAFSITRFRYGLNLPVIIK